METLDCKHCPLHWTKRPIFTLFPLWSEKFDKIVFSNQENTIFEIPKTNFDAKFGYFICTRIKFRNKIARVKMVAKRVSGGIRQSMVWFFPFIGGCSNTLAGNVVYFWMKKLPLDLLVDQPTHPHPKKDCNVKIFTYGIMWVNLALCLKSMAWSQFKLNYSRFFDYF